MGLDVFSISLATAQTLLRVFLQQHGAKVSGLRRKELVVHLGLAILDILVEFVPVFAIEGRKANEHFVDDGSKGPPIGGFAMALTLQNFRRQILCSSTETFSVLHSLNILFGKAEVGELDVAVNSYEDVFRLEVTIENVHLVEVLKGKENVSRVEPSGILLESTDLAEVKKELSARTVLQTKEQFVFTLESVVHLHDKRMVHRLLIEIIVSRV